MSNGIYPMAVSKGIPQPLITKISNKKFDIETLGIGVNKFTTGGAWGAFSCHLFCVSMSMNTDRSIPACIKHGKLQMHIIYS